MIQTFAELLTKNAETRQLARAYADLGRPVKFRAPEGDMTYLVSGDLSSETGGWRVTTFDKGGTPLGHYETDDAYEAFREVLAAGAREIPPPVPQEPPAAHDLSGGPPAADGSIGFND